MNDLQTTVFYMAIILAVLIRIHGWYFNSRRLRHRKKIKTAKALIRMFRSWESLDKEPRIIGYLRKIDPLVFEELVLTALKDLGAKIKRNTRYTGDGGIDGSFKLNGYKWLVQAKRYSGAINPQHILEFSEVCNGHKGLFVHTGRTGKKSKDALSPNISIISGDRLVGLVLGKPMEICNEI